MTGRSTLSLQSPIGRLDLTVSSEAVHRIDFRGVAPEGPVPKAVRPMFDAVRRQIGEYFAGKRRAFDLPLEPYPAGTDFQRLVWDAIGDIPWGQVVSYGDLAVWAGRPSAVRASASACGANRIPILIPCHRVVAKAGLGGYGGGLRLKRALLALERRDR
jgi:methylated-DNA-[protein]-cysteine S-methyltransferase